MTDYFLLDGLTSQIMYLEQRVRPEKFMKACELLSIVELTVLRDGMRQRGFTDFATFVQSMIDDRQKPKVQSA